MGKHFTIRDNERPDIPQMMLATVNALKAIGGSATFRELDERIANMEALTEDEQAFLLPDRKTRRLNYYLKWARVALKRGGALENSARGVWVLTDAGERMTSIEQARRLYERMNAEFRESRKARRLSGKKPAAAADSQEPDVEVLDDDGAAAWRAELLGVLQAMDPGAFERLAQRLLREAGFMKVDVMGKSGDGGLDGIGLLRVNLVSFQVYFQCKRWSNRVGASEIRNFRGALQGRTDKGLFITTTDFTAAAYQEARREGAIAIDLIDGERLCELLKDYGLGVRTDIERVEKVTINRDWFGSV